MIGVGYKITFDKEAEGETEVGEDAADKEVDIYRDTAVRYLGYANECGEAFRPLVPGYIVTLSYAVAIAYVSADAISKGFKCNKESAANFEGTGKSNLCAFPATLDVLTFQLLASVALPGFTINRWVAFVTYVINTIHLQDSVPEVVFNNLPTALGLALIPFIVAPLDNLVEEVLDKTTRPFLSKTFPLCELEPIYGAEPLP